MAYGEPEHLEECILSVKNQSVQSRILMTTSTPSEKTKILAEKYGIPLKINNESKGIAADWNFAYETADTKYLTLAHQDDVYMKNYAESCINAAEKCDDTLIVFTDYFVNSGGVVSGGGIKVLIKKLLLFPFYLNRKGFKSGLIKKFALSFGCPVCCPSVFYDRENLKGFRFSGEYKINLDWDAWIRMAGMDGRFLYNRKRSMIHRIHGGSETSRNLGLRKEEDRKIFGRLWFFPFSGLLSFVYRLSYSSFNK